MKAHSQGDNVDRSAGAIIALLQQAADVAREDFERAVAMSKQLSLQLRASEDRAQKLQMQVEQLETRAIKAENWIARIGDEVNKTFSFGEVKTQR
jgi:carboxylesterase type B